MRAGMMCSQRLGDVLQMWQRVAEPVSGEIDLAQSSTKLMKRRKEDNTFPCAGDRIARPYDDARSRPAAERVHRESGDLKQTPVMNATTSKDQKMIQSCLPREGRFYKVYNRVTLRFEALRRAASTLATPTKAEIIRIKKNRGDTLPRQSLMDLQRDQRLRPWSYVAGGVTRLSSCDVMHRRHSDVCDVLRGCSDATTSCITLHKQAMCPAGARIRDSRQVSSVGPNLSRKSAGR